LRERVIRRAIFFAQSFLRKKIALKNRTRDWSFAFAFQFAGSSD